MQTVYNIILWISTFVAILFFLLVFITGKGDAMSGSGGVRTSFKGKASFEDQMSKWTLILGVAFMAMMLTLDVISAKLPSAN